MRAIIIALVAAIAADQLHQRLDGIALPSPPSHVETLPSIEAVGLLSLGYGSLAADYYWLRALNEFGDREMHEVDYPNLEGLIRRLLALDPYYRTGYLLAGTALTLRGQNFDASIELLERGLTYRPDLWLIPMYLGFNLYYFKRDYAAAARVLARAAEHPDAPPVLGPLATRLAAEAGEPEMGLAMIDSLMPSLTDESLRQTYAERRQLLLLELHAKWIGQGVARFRELFGRDPERLEELVRPEIFSALPEEPLGGQFYLEDGEVRTTNEEKRLRLAPDAKGFEP